MGFLAHSDKEKEDRERQAEKENKLTHLKRAESPRSLDRG